MAAAMGSRPKGHDGEGGGYKELGLGSESENGSRSKQGTNKQPREEQCEHLICPPLVR